MALALSLPMRLAAVAAALSWLQAASSTLPTEAVEAECSAGLAGACAEDQVERAEAALALEMRTELLQQDVKRYRLSELEKKELEQKPVAEELLEKHPRSRANFSRVAGQTPRASAEASSSSHHESHSEHSHSSSNSTVAASTYNDSELSELVHAEQNLTAYVHAQAEIVARSTDELSRALVKVKASAQQGADLERRFDAARAKASDASERLEGFMAVLNKLRVKRDGLQNETALVQKQLDQLTRKYSDVARQYRDLLARLPEERGLNDSAVEAVRSAERQLHDAGSAEGTAKAVVKTESYGLQLAIEKLNQLNSELRTIEGRISTRYDRLDSYAPRSRWSSPLALLAFSVAGVQFTA